LNSRRRLVRLAHRILRNQEDAEDAVQDAFLSASRHFRNFEGRSAVTTWLTRIVINAAFMVRRKRKNSIVRSLGEANEEGLIPIETLPDLQLNPELAYSRVERFALLDGMIQEMNPHLSQAVKAAYYDDHSSLEASSALAISVSTYKGRLFRGTRLLQSRLRKRVHRRTNRKITAARARGGF
jgi:RNA polymerase sigma-70 factor, ECF subfamily